VHTTPCCWPRPNRRDPGLAVLGCAVRSGCIIVTLDVLQLAGILSSVESDAQQLPPPGSRSSCSGSSKSSGSSTTSSQEHSQERFRLLQKHVASAGQAWLATMGLTDSIEAGTEMTVQVGGGWAVDAWTCLQRGSRQGALQLKSAEGRRQGAGQLISFRQVQAEHG